ncbi:hypothetical protein E5361_07440 [Histophilus somni]|uniref:hypothetical protein n=1 Tax=Histophilus somni TaxID=731 RepID=UPI00109C2809|nr:hypothetical protein [Histophilus somni]THA21154.1 hypothetical protein E5361_07440 [Histophilus somni]
MTAMPEKSDRYLTLHALSILPILNGLTAAEIKRVFELISNQYIEPHLEEVIPKVNFFNVDDKTHRQLILNWGKTFETDNPPLRAWENSYLKITAPINEDEAEALINLVQRKFAITD